MDLQNNQALNTFQVVFLLGGPGSGKGTLSKHLVRLLPIQPLCMGDLLRHAATDLEFEHRETVRNHLDNGSLVPGEIALDLFVKALEECKHSFILLDGFPRSLPNLHTWNKDQRIHKRCRIKGIVALCVIEP